VRQKLDFVRRYKAEAAWNALTIVQAKEIKDKLGNLIIPAADDEMARQFDVLIGKASLKYLTNVSFQQEKKSLVAIAEALSKLGTVPQVKANASLIEAMQTESFWANVDYAVLEDIRKRLRGLIQLLKDNGKSLTVFTDFTDTLVEQKDGQYEPTGTAFKNYRLKVEKYIRENANHMVIWKLRMNKPLTKDDIGVLEGILWRQVGTKEEYRQEYHDKPLARLVREIAGLDIQAANEAFSTFLIDHTLTPEQIEFIKMIVDFVVKNGILDLSQLSKEPFKTIGSIVELFPTDKSKELLTVIKGINQNAGVG
jgi:type I restriction enzyme R subunit